MYATQHNTTQHNRRNSVTSRRIFKGTNPIKNIKRAKCVFCQSVFQWAKNCPEGTTGVKINEDVMHNCNITLFAREHLSDNGICVVESLGLALVDTAHERFVENNG